MPDILTIATLGSQVDTWLSAQEQLAPADPPRWLVRGHQSGAVAVRSAEHLTVLVASLDTDEFGVLVSPPGAGTAWGQTMRTEGGWIVEVSSGSSDDFAQRVYRGAEYACATDEDDDELLAEEAWSPVGAADVLWAWLGGALPSGCSRTLDYLSPEQRRKYGLE